MAKGMGALFKQAQKLQERLAQAQEALAGKTVEGTAGGGMVRVVMNGQQEVLEVHIDPEVVDPEDVEMLEDLVLAALQQAQERARQLAQEELAKAAGGMVPPGW